MALGKESRIERFKLALSDSAKAARGRRTEEAEAVQAAEDGAWGRGEEEFRWRIWWQGTCGICFRNALAEAAVTVTDQVKDFSTKCLICVLAIWAQVEESRLRNAAREDGGSCLECRSCRNRRRRLFCWLVDAGVADTVAR